MKPGFYKAIVKDNVDKMGMGRVKVYIPDFGGDPTDKNVWYTASYMSPYAGQTNPYLNKKGGKQEQESQDSYGIWANSYHPENEVIVSFVDGDESQPILMGAMFGQNMTASIAGYPSFRSTSGTVGGVHPPTVEYNKRDDEIDPRGPYRPRREKLTNQLWKQGLLKDWKRGSTDTSPHRDLVPQFQSFKTPGGNVFTIDDGKITSDQTGAGMEGRTYTPGVGASPYMRMRTAGGTQYMMSSDCGFIYMNSGDGASWVQISNTGIQMYTKGDLNMRAIGGYSQRSDGTHNIEVMGNMNVRSVGPINLEMEAGWDVKSVGDFNVTTAGFHSVKTPAGIIHEAQGNYNEQAGIAIFEFGATIEDQVKPGFPAFPAKELLTQSLKNRTPTNDRIDTGQAEGPTAGSAEDSTLPTGDFVTHEPWAGQPTACGRPSEPAEEGVSGADQTQPLADGTIEEVPGEEGYQGPSDPNDPMKPVEGRLSSPYGHRTHPVTGQKGKMHNGMDIAAPGGTPIQAPASGTVKAVKPNNGGAGNMVTIDHGNGYETTYMHMSKIDVRKGQQVTAGQVIGKVGSTGASTGNHLHYEVKKNGKYQDPKPYYDGKPFK